MKVANCNSCGKEFALNDLYRVFTRTLCSDCADADLQERELTGSSTDQVIRLSDPTVCGFCETDQGREELPSISDVPVCPACEHRLRKPKLPLWVKAAATMILILAGAELARNWRLFQGYFEMPRAYRAADVGDFDEAARQMALATGHLPEMTHLRVQQWFYQGMANMTKGKYDLAEESFEEARQAANKAGTFDKESRDTLEEWLMIAKANSLLEKDLNVDALALAEEFKRKFPKNETATALVNAARICVAFDSKDYITFEKVARECLAGDPEDAFAAAQLASALACRYAETGQEKFKTEATQLLDKARKQIGDMDSFKKYEERIRHRLKTREIIDRKEYNRRFRSGEKGQAQ